MKRALAVGVNAYGFPNDLTNGTRDAEAFAHTLESAYRTMHERAARGEDPVGFVAT